MKKKFIRTTFIVAIAMLGSINLFNVQESETLSDTVLANVEALAACEGAGYYTAYREYTAENGCFCLHCPEQNDTSCTCSK